eukprot:COSAG01_NODE_12105_length_1800_cov_2.820106_2_plen_241_part_00
MVKFPLNACSAGNAYKYRAPPSPVVYQQPYPGCADRLLVDGVLLVRPRNRSFGNSAEQLEQYAVTMSPPEGIWVKVGDAIDFRRMIQDENAEDDGREGEGGDDGGQRLVTEFHFRSRASDGKARIDRFLQTAFDWYVEQVHAQTDPARYLYMMQVAKDGGGGGDDDDDDDGGGDNKGPLYKRYKLSEEKTFDSLFFPQKAKLLHLLKHFTEKKGKFAIPVHTDSCEAASSSFVTPSLASV